MQIARDASDASALMVLIRELWIEKALAVVFVATLVISWFITSFLGAIGYAMLACLLIVAAFGGMRVAAWVLPAPFAWLARQMGHA